jgi:hypothetical protein
MDKNSILGPSGITTSTTVENSKTKTFPIPTNLQKKSSKPEKDIFLELYKKLSAPIEDKYIIEYEEEGKKFKGYNAQAAINRLNEVVGIGNWEMVSDIRKEEIIGKAWAVAMEIKIIIKLNKELFSRTGNGGAFAKNIANAYKGARTSAFKNACRYFGIGKELYEQNIDDDIIEVKVKEDESTEVTIPQEVVDLETKINNCKTIEQLQSLEESVKAVKETSVQKIIIKKYNDKKIQLMS